MFPINEIPAFSQNINCHCLVLQIAVLTVIKWAEISNFVLLISLVNITYSYNAIQIIIIK